MSPSYRRTQYSGLLISILGAALLFMTWLALDTAYHPVFVAAALLIGGALLVFNSLTVRVDSDQVRLHFGLGWPRRAIPLAEIRDVCLGETSLSDGWGIRLVPNGKLYRIGGRQTVDLDLTEGRVVRIATDDPETLAGAIEDALIAGRGAGRKL